MGQQTLKIRKMIWVAHWQAGLKSHAKSPANQSAVSLFKRFAVACALPYAHGNHADMKVGNDKHRSMYCIPDGWRTEASYAFCELLKGFQGRLSVGSSYQLVCLTVIASGSY